MKPRLEYEQKEKEWLSDKACFSSRTLGRRKEEIPCDIRTDFQRDRDRVIHSKSFRRLKHKTQVFLSPEGDHYRTRMTHTLEVAQISRTIARALRLNEDLTEAIAMAHDLGHTPFGHCGETVLNRIYPGGFIHNEQSLRVVDLLEDGRYEGFGLNLTEEVRDGILHHSGKQECKTLEGDIVRLSDRIAYINHDIDDAMRAGMLEIRQIPKECLDCLGESHGERINTMVVDVIENSMNKEYICMSEQVAYETNKLRNFMFEHIYLNPKAKGEEGKAQKIIEQLYGYFTVHQEELPENIRRESGQLEGVKDYIAGMSDRYAIKKFKDIYIPEYWV
jgi:dGTPase